MESGFLLLIALSAGAGLVLRRRVSPELGRAVLLLGLGALAVGVTILGLTVLGRGPLAPWTASLVSVALLAVAALTFPFGVTVSLGRR